MGGRQLPGKHKRKKDKPKKETLPYIEPISTIISGTHEQSTNFTSATINMSHPLETTNRKISGNGKHAGIAAAVMSLVQVGLPMIGIQENLVLGVLVWIAIIVLSIYAIWVWETSYRYRVIAKAILSILVVTVILAITESPAEKLYQREHPKPSPQVEVKPLEFVAISNIAKYPNGTVIDGIRWRDTYTGLRVSIINDSDQLYTDIDLRVRPDVPVVEAVQSSTVPDVSIGVFEKPNLDMESINSSSGEGRAVPLKLLATDVGYRIQIPRLQQRTPLELLMVTVTMMPGQEHGGAFDSTYWIQFQRVEKDKRFGVWFGAPGAPDVMFSAREASKEVVIEGHFFAQDGRKVTVGKDVAVINQFQEAAQKIFHK